MHHNHDGFTERIGGVRCVFGLSHLPRSINVDGSSMVKPGPVLRVNSEDLEIPTVNNDSFTSVSIAPVNDDSAI